MIRIILLTAYFIIPQFGRTQSGMNVFDDSYIHEIRLTFTDPDYWDTLLVHYDAVYDSNPPDFDLKQYVLASFVEIDGVVLDSVGFRIKGLTSSGISSSKRKHFKVDFGEFKDWKFDGLRKLNLSNTYSDGTMLRDALAYDLLRSLSIPAPRTSYFKLYLNNEYWGLYVAIEQVDKEFLENYFVQPHGNLYKPFFRNALSWHGQDWAMYEDTMELRTNEGTLYHSELLDFIEFINTAPDGEFLAGIGEVLDFDKALTQLAVDYIIGNGDSPFIQGRNYFIYADQFHGKVKLIPWDFNFSFNSGVELIQDFAIILGFDTVPRNIFRSRLQTIPAARQVLLNRVCEIAQSFTPEYLNSIIDPKIALIRDELILEPHQANWMPHSNNSLSNLVQALKNFIQSNGNRINGDLSDEGFWCYLGSDDHDEPDFSVAPNPAVDVIRLRTGFSIDKLTVVNSLGELILMLSNIDPGMTEINCSRIETGFYYLIIESDGQVNRVKFEKMK